MQETFCNRQGNCSSPFAATESDRHGFNKKTKQNKKTKTDGEYISLLRNGGNVQAQLTNKNSKVCLHTSMASMLMG